MTEVSCITYGNDPIYTSSATGLAPVPDEQVLLTATGTAGSPQSIGPCIPGVHNGGMKRVAPEEPPPPEMVEKVDKRWKEYRF